MRKTLSHSIFLLLVLGSLSLADVHGAEFDFTPEFLDREKALEAAETVTVESYPDADTVLVDGAQWVRYRPDGTYVKWAEKYTRILNEKGRRKYQTFSSYFTIPYQRGPEDCRIPVLEIIKPDGTVVPIDVEKQGKIMVNSASMKNNIYDPNSRLIRVNVAGLEVGDIIHSVMYDRIVHPRVPDTWFDWLTFESQTPIVRRSVSIYAPKELPLRSIALKGEIEGTITGKEGEEDGLLLYQWEARNVPRLFPEPNMPTERTVAQRLLVSTAPDWESVSRWYWGLSEPHLEITPEIEAKVAELTAGLEDSREKIEAIFRFVSQKIRYLGIISETAAPGYEPHDVKDTFGARHGVCRDKAALLAAMLRSAGFDAYPALIYVGPKKDPEVPQPFFNHAITALRQDDGSYLLMDSTDETTAELLPAYLNDKSYLVATPAGDTLRTSPIDPAANNLMCVDTIGAVDQKGMLTAVTVFRFEGINDNAYRRSFAGKKPEDRRRFFEALMKTAMATARVDDVTIEPEDLMDTARPLTARVRYSADDVLIRGENAVMLPLPAIGFKVGVLNTIIGKTGLEKRRFPFRTRIACGVRERIDLELDPSLGEAVFLPEGSPVENEGFFWKLAARQSGSKLEYESDFRLRAVEFSPEEYLRLKETLQQIERDSRRMPIFAAAVPGGGDQSAPPADVLILEDRTDYRLTDSHLWTKTRSVKKKILTYAGKKESGELKFPHNPAWEEITLDRATITNPDGSARSISEGEINLMDAPWVGSAPRYPGGKILVASLPRLEIGSIVEYSYTSTCRDRPFFANYITFQSYNALGKKTVTLEAPADLSLIVFPDEIETVAMEKADPGSDGTRILYRWTAEDLPPLKREERLPPRWSFLPTVFLSAGEWKTYADEVHGVLTAAADGQRESERRARLLVEGESDPWKKLELIRDFIALNVRPAGPDLHELPLSAVTAADRTLKDGYGNTTDRAVLCYAMLKAAGFTPEFVLASPRPMIDRFADLYRKVPNQGSFPIVLVRVNDPELLLEDGRAVYLNDTDQYAAVGATGHEGKMAITLPGGRLEEILPVLETSTEHRIRMTVAGNGDVVISLDQRPEGNEYGKGKKFFAELTPEKKRRYYQELAGKFSKAARTKGELTADFSGYPGLIRCALTVPAYAVIAGDYLYFRRPATSPVFKLSSDTRVNPLYLKVCRRTNDRLTIELPPGFAVDYLPESLTRSGVSGADLDLDFNFRALPGKDGAPVRIEIRADQSLLPSIVEPDRYRELLDLYRTLIDARFQLILLRRENSTID